MAKKKRYLRDEVQDMLDKKYPSRTGSTVFLIQDTNMSGYRYRVDLRWFKNLSEIVDRFNLE